MKRFETSSRKPGRRGLRRIGSVMLLGLVIMAASGLANATTAGPPSNDNFPGKEITGFPYSDELDTKGATVEQDEPRPSCVESSSVGATVWYKWTPTRPTPAVVDTTASEYDTIVAVWQVLPFMKPKSPFMWEVACNDDAALIKGSKAGFIALPGFTYYIQVAGKNGATGELDFDLDLGARVEDGPARGGANTDYEDVSADAEVTSPAGGYGAAADTETGRIVFCAIKDQACI